jgi:hypothetical protein
LARRPARLTDWLHRPLWRVDGALVRRAADRTAYRSRPQIQEEAIVQLAELLRDKMQPDGLAIVMEADHCCMQWRGVKDMDSRMTNSIMRGSFLKNPDLWSGDRRVARGADECRGHREPRRRLGSQLQA